MGNLESSQIGGKPAPLIVPKKFKLIKINIPYQQLELIRSLQKSFDYEVKGTINLDKKYLFDSFLIRTDSSSTHSYGDAAWKISYHTHPDQTAKRYGIRYFSPPSVDDIIEIYEHSLCYVPSNVAKRCGELSIIFTNEGIYVLQVNRTSFAKFNEVGMPIEVLEELLNHTLTDFMVNNIKTKISQISGSNDMKNPDITLDQYSEILRDMSSIVSKDFGLDMYYYPWTQLESDGLNLQIYDYHVKNLNLN